MIHLDFIDRRQTTATVPFVCMHCDDPTCAQVCPLDAIKKTEDGVVQSHKPRYARRQPMALIAALLIVQMWLLTATLEAFLAGHREPALPAAILSALLFGACFSLYLFIERVDRARSPHTDGGSTRNERISRPPISG
jgi:4Fe-4S dicluster domain